MRGLIIKDYCMLWRVDKKLPITMYILVLITNFLNRDSAYALISSALFVVALSIHMMMTMTYDGGSNWKRTEIILPLSDTQVVLAKYIFAYSGIIIGVAMTGILLLLHKVIYNTYDPTSFKYALYGSLIIPILWASICLPFAYCLNYMSTQYLRVILVVLILLLIKEHGLSDAFANLKRLSFPLIAISCLAVAIISFLISVKGHQKRT